jgi:hypothetical protein
MKVTNWRRKLAQTLVASGLLAPAALHAQSLDTNLLVNPGFESVDITISGEYGAVKVLNWTGNGFAYSHHPEITTVPDYGEGADPPNAGNWYFTSNEQADATTGDIRTPGVFYQDINVSAGAAGAQIASGEASVRLRAYMTSYSSDSDAGNVHVEFRNSNGVALGSAQISDPDFGPDNVWSLTTGAAVIPATTTTLRVSLFGTPRNSGADGYIDNVDVQVGNAADDFLFLHVNTATGQVAIKNQAGDPVHIDHYTITSNGSSLNKNAWTSLQDQNLAGFPAGNGQGNGWEEGGVTNNKVVSENFLLGNSLVANGGSIPLGALYNVGGAHDLVFRYSVVPGLQPPLEADFDSDGDADGADFLQWQRGLGITTGATKPQGDANGDGAINAADLAIWRQEAGGPSGPGSLVTGFVHYAATGPITAVPEPSTILIAALLVVPLRVGARLGEERSHLATRARG